MNLVLVFILSFFNQFGRFKVLLQLFLCYTYNEDTEWLLHCDQLETPHNRVQRLAHLNRGNRIDMKLAGVK